MEDTSLLALILGGGTGGAIILALVQKYFNRAKEAAETTALIADATGKTNVIEVLERRVSLSEDRHAKQDARIAELEIRVTQEITLRLSAQEENHILRMRVSSLEHEIMQLRANAQALVSAKEAVSK